MKKDAKKVDELVVSNWLIKGHGFTPTLVKKLGEPDETTVNPHYRSGPPMRLYSLSRALRFKAANPALFERAKSRKAAAAKGVQTKAKHLDEDLDRINLEFINPLPATFEELYSIAESHARSRYRNAEPPTLKGVISTVRHDFTNYDERLEVIRGRVGSGTHYEMIREEVDREILFKLRMEYPEEFPAVHASPQTAKVPLDTPSQESIGPA